MSQELLNEFTLNWDVEGIGFGQFKFYQKQGVIYCDNETMNKQFIKQVLSNLVDNCILTD